MRGQKVRRIVKSAGADRRDYRADADPRGDAEMRVMQEEIFGPILPIVTATLDDALAT